MAENIKVVLVNTPGGAAAVFQQSRVASRRGVRGSCASRFAS